MKSLFLLEHGAARDPKRQVEAALPHPYQSLEGAGQDGSPGKYVQKEIALSLFDLDTDPGDTVNVGDRNPAVVKQILEHAERAREDLGDSLTTRTGKNVRAAVAARQGSSTAVLLALTIWRRQSAAW